MQKREGFTIIELIVVIAIIAVLAAIVLVNVTQYINKSKDAAIKGEMDQLRKCAATWAADGNLYLSEDKNHYFIESDKPCGKMWDALEKV